MTLKRISLAILSGLFLILSFPPFNLSVLVWIAVVPLLLAIKDARIKEAANLGAITGLVLYCGNLWWFIRLFGPSITCLGLLSLLALFIALFSFFYRFVSSHIPSASPAGGHPISHIIFPPIIWVAVEFFRSECYPLKFTWLSLGYSQGQNLPLLQSASLFGVYGISFLIVLVNATIAYTISVVRRPPVLRSSNATATEDGSPVIRKTLPVIIVAIVVSTCFIYGSIILRTPSPRSARFLRNAELRTPILKVAIIQDESHNLSRLSSLTHEATKEKPDLVIWPEYSLPFFYTGKEEKFEELTNLAKEIESHFIVGVIDSTPIPDKFTPAPHGGAGFINKALIFSPQGDLIGEYAKIHTVQFVEELLIPGKEAKVFATSLGKIGIELCYDLDYIDLTRTLVKNGAQLLIVPNYDPKRWGRIQHIQHSAMSPLRAVEARRYIVRAASSGISQIIDPYGRIIETLDFGISDILIGEVKLNKEIPFFTRYGFLFPYLCQGLTIGLFLFAIFKRRS
jgi:apolipoprotein N-acyltransferase